MRQSKNSAASYIFFLNTFLIFSTVIVFAVLLFLSYQNVYHDNVEELREEVTSTLDDIAIDYNSMILLNEDPDIALSSYINSHLLSDNGNIYILNGEGSLFAASEPLDSEYSLMEMGFDEVFALLADGDFSEVSVERRNDSIVITGICSISSDRYCVVVNVVHNSEIIVPYMKSIMVPALISLLVAILLYIILVTMTSRPLHEISQVISKVAKGDFSARVDEKYTKSNEFSMYTVSSDLTDMAKTLNDMLEIVDNQERDRSIFISSVAHDIRTPLTSINGFVTAMLDGTIPPDSQEKYLNIIKEQVDRIRSLVMSMTEASSLSHVDPSMMEPFNIAEVISDVAENLEPQLAEKNIRILTRVDDSTDNMVYGEAQQLCRVVFNIVTNAIKFTPNGGTIRISSWPEKREDKMYISVEDSGPGVPPDKRNRVFESFYKADSARTKVGFGLGLYICKQILLGHGQGIVLDESPDLGGANFIFSFPLPPKEGR